jgi:hypothetical protein
LIVRHLRILNFRGIRNLDWHLEGRVICLVGPNDSTKTAILDAIELVLLPRGFITLTDADFYKVEVASPITIEATIGELPSELLVEPEKFGLYLRGYKSGDDVHDDPGADCEQVLTIRFSMDQELDPTWTVIKLSQENPKPIRARDRERLGLARLGADADRHLTWGRGSALLKLTEEITTTGHAFVEVARAAKQVVANADLPQLVEAASKAKESASELGAEFGDLRPGLDISALSLGGSVLGLHETGIPARLWGLGTRRLAALGIQQKGVGQQSILVIDEIEHGLEPHRIRHVLRRLHRGPDGNERKLGQIIFSTHSPTAIIELPIQNLRFVRSNDGITRITSVKADCAASLQPIARLHSPAFLGRKLLVCEGATEVGLCRGLEEYWAKENSGKHPSHIGFVTVDGRGRTSAPGIAQELKRIGYDVAVFGDSDEPLEPAPDDLAAEGIPVFQWPNAMSTEQRLVKDLPADSIQALLDEAYREFDPQSLVGQVAHFCAIPNLWVRGTNLVDWLGTDLTPEQTRDALASAAKKNSWFKNVSLGIRVGEIVADALPTISNSPTANTLSNIMKWIYG